MTPLVWMILLFCAGVALIIAEFFIPGAVAGIVGGLCLLGGAVYGIISYPSFGFLIGFIYILGSIFAVVGGVFILPRTRAGKRLMLAEGIDQDKDWVSDVTREDLIGKEGEVFSRLRPAGDIMVGNERIDAVSNGSYIEKGAPVRIIEVHGNRVVVERTDEE